MQAQFFLIPYPRFFHFKTCSLLSQVMLALIEAMLSEGRTRCVNSTHIHIINNNNNTTNYKRNILQNALAGQGMYRSRKYPSTTLCNVGEQYYIDMATISNTISGTLIIVRHHISYGGNKLNCAVRMDMVY